MSGPWERYAAAEEGPWTKFAAAPAPEEPGIGAQALRTAEFGARGFFEKAADIVGSVPDAIASGLRAAGVPMDPNENYYSDAIKTGMRETGKFLARPINALLPDNMGPNEPVNALERGAYAAGSGAADAASIFVPAAAVSNASRAGTMTNTVANALKAQPVAQTVAGSAGSVVGDATDNPYLGMATSLAIPVAGNLAGNALATRSARKEFIADAPSTEKLAAEGSRLFEKAKGASAVISKPSYDEFIGGLRADMAEEGADLALHPKLVNAVNAIGKRDGDQLDMKGMQTARRILGIAAGSIEPDEARIAVKLRDKLDDFVENLKPSDLAAGETGTAAADLKAARETWQRMRKSETITEIIEKAKTQASGVENGLRIGFRQLLNNKKALRGFSDEEVDAIRDVAEGTFTGNTLRLLGKLGYGSGAQTNFLGGSIGVAGGSALLGPAGAVIAPALGYAAQRGAQASTAGAAEYARAVAASGGGPRMPRNSLTSMFLGDQTEGANLSLLSKIAAGQDMTPVRERSLR